MSKSMAIDSIMKLFLMVAVIIVGMSFLLKAFGIDIIGWLMDKFAGFGVPEKGRFLYFKVDPEDGNQFFAAYLDSNPIQKIEHAKLLVATTDNYFAYFVTDTTRDDFLEDCVLYTVDEQDSKFDNRDEAYVYYVLPGTIIQDGCNSLDGCLGGKYLSSCTQNKKDTGNCFPIQRGDLTKCNDEKKGDFSTVNCVCGVGPDSTSKCDSTTNKGDREVESKPIFVNNERTEGCKLKNGVPEERSICNLLTNEETNFKLKYGLICSNGQWRTCKEDNKGNPSTSVTIGGTTHECEVDNEHIGRWS